MENNNQDLKRLSFQHVFVPQRPWNMMTAEGGYHIFVSGQGCRVTDTEGKTYLDFWGTIQGANLLGYGRQDIAQAAYDQMLKLHFAPTHDGNIPKIQLAAKLASLAPDKNSRVFFASGGTESIETALKLARKYQQIRGFPYRHKILSPLAYHGSTLGAMGTGWDIAFKWEDFQPLPSGYIHVRHPWCSRCELDLHYPDCKIQCARQVERIIQEENPETVAAFIDTPVSSFNHASPPEYWPMVREICTRYGVLLIFDCIACGLGRTGRMFAAEHFGVVPDVIVIGKGLAGGYLPISAAIITADVAKAFEGGSQEVLMHSFTFEGHAAACAAAIKTLEIMEAEQLVKRSWDMGQYLYQQLQTLYDLKIVGEVRGGMGLMCNVELMKDRADKIRFNQAENARLGGLLKKKLMAAGLWGNFRNPLPIYPALCITKDEIDEIVTGFRRVISDIQQEF